MAKDVQVKKEGSVERKVRRHRKINPIERAKQQFQITVKTKNGLITTTDTDRFGEWLLKYMKSAGTMSMVKGYHV